MKKLMLFSCLILAALMNFHCNKESIEQDPCANTTCYHGGYCVDGSCDCPDWYEGANCSQEVRNKFVGAYSGTLKAENWAGIIISPAILVFSPSSAGVQFISIENGYLKIQLTNASGNFVVPVQPIPGSNETATAGYGYFSGNQVFLTYGLTAPDGSVSIYTFTGSK